jgi:hypothetical protein
LKGVCDGIQQSDEIVLVLDDNDEAQINHEEGSNLGMEVTLDGGKRGRDGGWDDEMKATLLSIRKTLLEMIGGVLNAFGSDEELVQVYSNSTLFLCFVFSFVVL